MNENDKEQGGKTGPENAESPERQKYLSNSSGEERVGETIEGGPAVEHLSLPVVLNNSELKELRSFLRSNMISSSLVASKANQMALDNNSIHGVWVLSAYGF